VAVEAEGEFKVHTVYIGLTHGTLCAGGNSR
jgi:hypothetical protein